MSPNDIEVFWVNKSDEAEKTMLKLTTDWRVTKAWQLRHRMSTRKIFSLFFAPFLDENFRPIVPLKAWKVDKLSRFGETTTRLSFTWSFAHLFLLNIPHATSMAFVQQQVSERAMNCKTFQGFFFIIRLFMKLVEFFVAVAAVVQAQFVCLKYWDRSLSPVVVGGDDSHSRIAVWSRPT